MNLHNILCLLLILVDVRLGPMNFQYRFDSPQGIHISVLTVLVTTSFPFSLHIICINISIITGRYWRPYQASDPATTSINVEAHHVLSPCPLEKKRIESIIISVYAMLSEWVSESTGLCKNAWLFVIAAAAGATVAISLCFVNLNDALVRSHNS